MSEFVKSHMLNRIENENLQEFQICSQKKQDESIIEKICDQVFGKNRYFEKSSYLLRKNVEPIEKLCLVGKYQQKIIATIRAWPIIIGESEKIRILLGPIAVTKKYQGMGYAKKLIAKTVDIARINQYDLMLLVGDIDYYAKSGFKKVPLFHITMPDNSESHRICYFELQEKILRNCHGKIRKLAANIQLCQKK